MTHPHTPDAPPADQPAARSWPSALLVLPGLAALTLVAALAACESGGGASTAAASASTDSLVAPIEIRSAGGVLDVTLEALVDTLPVPGANGSTNEVLRTYRLLAANGVSYADSNKVGFPGPTFRVAQGDSVRILLLNHLPADTAGCMAYPAAQPRDSLPPVDVMEDCFHGPNSTNLHFHGFHVSPDSGADNVLMQVAPGDSFQYAFRIPMDQSPGTHWYHPHKHGSVALQVSNGMSGAFIVEGGGLDSLTRAMNMREVLVAVQEIDPSMNLVDSSVAQAKLVNGQYQPTIDMRPGEVIRMRLVNENVSRTASYNLVFSENPSDSAPELYDVARDGVQYAPANYDTITPDTSLFVAPGNRLDMFVRAPTQAGTHELRSVVAPVQNNSGKGGSLPIAREQTVLRVRVRGEAGTGYATTLPGALPPLPDFLANLDTSIVRVSHSIVFTDSGGTRGPKQNPNPPSFFLGTTDSVYQKFNDTVTMVQMPVNTTQVWMVYNRSPNQLNHPFHIHINPFQVDSVFAPDSTDPNYDYYRTLNAASAGGNPIWLDVLALPRPDANGNEGWIRIRQRYVRYTGPFVMHCHILGHEERGMMQRIAIVDGAVPPTAQAASGARGGRTSGGGGAGGGGGSRAGGGGGRAAPAAPQDEHGHGHSH